MWDSPHTAPRLPPEQMGPEAAFGPRGRKATGGCHPSKAGRKRGQRELLAPGHAVAEQARWPACGTCQVRWISGRKVPSRELDPSGSQLQAAPSGLRAASASAARLAARNPLSWSISVQRAATGWHSASPHPQRCVHAVWRRWAAVLSLRLLRVVQQHRLLRPCADSTAGLRPFGKLSRIPGAPVWVFFTWERRFHTSGTSASSQQGATANTPKLSSRQPSSLLAPFLQGPLSTKFPPPHGAGPSCSTAHGPWNQPCPTAPKPGEPTGRAASLRPREAVRVRRRPRAKGRSTAEGACRQRCPTRVSWANWAALILGRILGC